MNPRPGTLSHLIDAMARETGAPESFVERVSSLFTSKGISLDDDGLPYAEAVRDTFLCDAKLRIQAARAKEGLDQLRERLIALAENWERQLQRAESVRSTLQDTLRAAEQARDLRRARTITIVPGPREIQ